jgi:hypothetical protein
MPSISGMGGKPQRPALFLPLLFCLSFPSGNLLLQPQPRRRNPISEFTLNLLALPIAWNYPEEVHNQGKLHLRLRQSRDGTNQNAASEHENSLKNA